jgi:hypothetical protein
MLSLKAFFQRWWREQDDATRSLTKDLVGRGQLNFVNGGEFFKTPNYLALAHV